MAICNIFPKDLTSSSGTFLTFSQYTDDLTKCFVQHNCYDIVPSKFVALHITGDDGTSSISGVSNILTTNYENPLAHAKSGNVEGLSGYNPDISKHMFWQAMFSEGYLSQIQYAGDIDIHSYEEKDGIGYSEVYCYIPEDAKKMVMTASSSGVTYVGQCPAECCGRTDSEGRSFEAVPIYTSITVNGIYPYSADKPAETGDSMTINAIVVLYDIVAKDKSGHEEVLHSNLPMGIYLAADNNVIHKLTPTDSSGVGTTYGLRICTRFMVTPANGVTVTHVDTNQQYAGFARAMSSMAESQELMKEIISRNTTDTKDLKTILDKLGHQTVNVPSILYKYPSNGATGFKYSKNPTLDGVAGEPYWFVNGKDTGVKASVPGTNGIDGADISINGDGYWIIKNAGSDQWRNTSIKAAATQITIGDDGYWYIDGEKQAIHAGGHLLTIDSNGYWCMDGELMKDQSGKAVVARAKDGDPGIPGHSPVISIGSGNYWYVDNELMKDSSGNPVLAKATMPSIEIGSNGNLKVDGKEVNVNYKLATPTVSVGTGNTWLVGGQDTTIRAFPRIGIGTNADNKTVWTIDDQPTAAIIDTKLDIESSLSVQMGTSGVPTWFINGYDTGIAIPNYAQIDSSVSISISPEGKWVIGGQTMDYGPKIENNYDYIPNLNAVAIKFDSSGHQVGNRYTLSL